MRNFSRAMRTSRQGRIIYTSDGYIERITPGRHLEEGVVTLYGSTGIAYRTKALNVPGYGLVPCSKKLEDNFTNESSRLIVVHSSRYITSNIWITLS